MGKEKSSMLKITPLLVALATTGCGEKLSNNPEWMDANTRARVTTLMETFEGDCSNLVAFEQNGRSAKANKSGYQAEFEAIEPELYKAFYDRQFATTEEERAKASKLYEELKDEQAEIQARLDAYSRKLARGEYVFMETPLRETRDEIFSVLESAGYEPSGVLRCDSDLARSWGVDGLTNEIRVHKPDTPGS